MHRLGQIQAARQVDTFHVVHQQRSIGYGFKEYASSKQIRKPSFNHMPLVLAAVDCECACAADGCGTDGSPCVSRHEVAKLAIKLKCPYVQIKAGESLHSAFDALTADSHRLDDIAGLSAIAVPRHAQPRPALHMGDERAVRWWEKSWGCRMM